MKFFDYSISNPPYQDKKNKPIYQKFHTKSHYYSRDTIMIYMTRWWITMPAFKKLIIKNTSKIIYYSQNYTSEKLFPTTEIAKGVNIVIENEKPNNNITLSEPEFTIEKKIHNDEIDKISIRASEYDDITYYNSIIEKYGSLRDKYVPNVNPFRLTGEKLSFMSPQLYDESTFNHAKETIIYANISGSKGGKSDYYSINQKIETHNNYSICIGQSIIENDNRPLRFIVLEPGVIYGRSLACIYTCNTKEEADNFIKYANTHFFHKALRLSLQGRMKTLCSTIPDIKNYTTSNPNIDWNKPLNEQLEEYFRI